MRLGIIVEGHGEVLAAPTLISRILSDLSRHEVRLHNPPVRVRRGKFNPKFDDYERALRLLAGVNDAVLVILDSDDDNPVSLKSELETRALTCISHRQVLVAPAVREYESWFLASISALAGTLDVREDAQFSGDPDIPRGAKGIFESKLVDVNYSETIDQKRYSAVLDIDEARARSASFSQLVDCVEELTR